MASLSETHPARLGIVLGLAAGAALSTGGVALRFVEEASGWQVLFYRALAFSVMMACVLGWRHRAATPAHLRAVGSLGLVVAVMLGLGAIAYVFAILHTSVANVVVILSAAPILTAVLSHWLLGERTDLVTWLAMLTVVGGILVMFADGLQAGGVLGLLIALGAALMYALMLVALRRARSIDMLPATALSGPVTVCIAALMVDGLAIPAADLALSVFLGTFQFGLGFALVTIATRYIAAAHVALLTLTEVVLAPLWVFVAIGEAPTMLGLAGALVVFAAVLAQAGYTLHARRAGKMV
ncbi:MAG: DMT family transporter [Pseudomonadota bacterium]